MPIWCLCFGLQIILEETINSPTPCSQSSKSTAASAAAKMAGCVYILFYLLHHVLAFLHRQLLELIITLEMRCSSSPLTDNTLGAVEGS